MKNRIKLSMFYAYKPDDNNKDSLPQYGNIIQLKDWMLCHRGILR